MGETPAYPSAFLSPTVGIVGFVSFCFLAGVLLYASYTDLKRRIIPNRAIVAAVCGWVLIDAVEAALLLTEGVSFGEMSVWLAKYMAPALSGAFFLSGFALVSSLAMDRILNKESLGGGDIKLLFAMGLYLGPERGMAALCLACLLLLPMAAAFAMSGKKKEWDKGFPFAPFLTAGALFVVLICS